MKTMTKTLTIAKASPVTRDAGDEVPSVVIRICEDLEWCVDQEGMAGDQLQAWFRGQASALARALRDALPGGTLDALLVELLAVRCSTLKVRR